MRDGGIITGLKICTYLDDSKSLQERNVVFNKYAHLLSIDTIIDNDFGKSNKTFR